VRLADASPLAFRRLDSESKAPIAVAFSGGGDSLLALIQTLAWARKVGRQVLALTVDHGLQAQSSDWTQSAGEQARALWAEHQSLAWLGDKPTSGRPAAARSARHRLLAEAARAGGAKVIVTGHTRDDALENALMGLGPIAEWSPSPVWPEGRGLFLLRPLIGARRTDIRAALSRLGQRWLDDPVNDDPAHPRARARAAIAAGATPEAEAAPDFSDFFRAIHFVGPAVSVERAVFTRRGAGAALSAILACVGGAERPWRGGSLLDRLAGDETFTATSTGSRIEAAPHDVLFCREAGEIARGGLKRLGLEPCERAVWDGRYEIEARDRAVQIAPLASLAGRLPRAQMQALKGVPAPVRASLPAAISADGEVVCTVLTDQGLASVDSLVQRRLAAALGAIGDERAACDALHMAKSAYPTYLEVLGERGVIHELA